jgi:hypothetical protein
MMVPRHESGVFASQKGPPGFGTLIMRRDARARPPGRGMSRVRRSLPAAFALVLVAGAARAETLEAVYDLSLAGLPIGQATLGARLAGDSYKLDVRAKLTGLAGMLTGGKGAGTAAGSTSGTRVMPASYALNSAGSSGTVVVRMSMNQGNVAAVEISPPLDPRIERVPVAEEHRRGIVDPVSALLMPVPGKGPMTEAAACNRTLPVFDGAGRFDVALSYAGSRQVSIPGYAGPVAVCSARYVPISGHRPNRKATQFMAENRELEAWLAPVEGTRMLVPLRISVKTMVGTTIIEASRFSVNGKSTAQAAKPDGEARN